MKLYVVGIGPGDSAQMTPQALQIIRQSDVVVGYTKYIEIIAHLIEEKTIRTSEMKNEKERCQIAIMDALKGKNVVVVSSGDAGIYGMAGLIYELAEECDEIEVCVVPGITAASSAAAVLGAPLMNDFAVISLSDLLTDWSVIEKRLRLAAEADFVIVLYNPSSIKRFDYLQKACDIVGAYRPDETPCGYVKNIAREGQESCVCTLASLRNTKVNMFTTVVIGNSTTRVIRDKLVTPRGYRYV